VLIGRGCDESNLKIEAVANFHRDGKTDLVHPTSCQTKTFPKKIIKSVVLSK